MQNGRSMLYLCDSSIQTNAYIRRENRKAQSVGQAIRLLWPSDLWQLHSCWYLRLTPSRYCIDRRTSTIRDLEPIARAAKSRRHHLLCHKGLKTPQHTRPPPLQLLPTNFPRIPLSPRLLLHSPKKHTNPNRPLKMSSTFWTMNTIPSPHFLFAMVSQYLP